MLKYETFARNALKNGHSIAEIRDASLKKGWPIEIVDRELAKFK